MKSWGTLAVAAAIAAVLAFYLTREPDRAFLSLRNDSLERISVVVTSGETLAGAADLGPGERRFFSAANVTGWDITCEDMATHRRVTFRPPYANRDRNPYLTVSLDGCRGIKTASASPS